MKELICLFLFLIFGHLNLRKPHPRLRIAFLGLQIAMIYYLGFSQKPWHFVSLSLLLMFHYFSLEQYLKHRKSWLYWLTFLLPLSFLIVVKEDSKLSMLGVSYLAFRLCYITAEAKTSKLFKLQLMSYFEFAFFLPIFSMGPIVRYSEFHRPLSPGNWNETVDHIFRLIWGIFKVKVLSTMFLPLTFSSLFFDGYRHGIIDLFIASSSYLFYVYFNFSGYMDIMISAASLIGRKLPENFKYPFYSRNIQEFWNHWHITLTAFMRDIFFLPVLKNILKRTKVADYAAAPSTLLVTFILTGIWHGFAWNYFYYGLFHGFGLVCHFFYTRFISANWNSGLKAYQQLFWPKLIGQISTFTFVSLSMIFFANDLESIKKIYNEILVFSF